MDSHINRKRPAHWEGHNRNSGRSCQLPRGENGSVGSHSEDENRERIRADDDMSSCGSTHPSGQEHEAQFAFVRQNEIQQTEGKYIAASRGSRLWQSLGRQKGTATTVAGLPKREGSVESCSLGSSSNCGMEGYWSQDCTGGKVLSSPTKRAVGKGTATTVAGSPKREGNFKSSSSGYCSNIGTGGDWSQDCIGRKVLSSSTKRAVGEATATTVAVSPEREGNIRSSSSGTNRGMEGNRSQDCTGGKVLSSPSKRTGGEGQETPKLQERLCPCGAGACAVFTANTEKNKGRCFYKCPLGKCTFFEWCDAGRQGMPTQQPELPCTCGGGPCRVLTARTEKNNGRQFYRCPKPQSCSFFKWCDEVGRDARGNSCFNCEGGHWYKDCPYQKHYTYRTFGGTAAGYTGDWICYACRNPGHFAGNCPYAHSIVRKK